MGSKGDRQDVLRVWTSTGFHPASPGPAVTPAIHSLTGLPAGSLRTLLTIRRDEPVAASLGRSTVRHRCRSCAVPSQNLIRSVGCRARPPSSGRPVRPRSPSRGIAGASRPLCRREPEAPNRLKAGGCLLTTTPARHPVVVPGCLSNRGHAHRRGSSFFQPLVGGVLCCGRLAATADGTGIGVKEDENRPQ